MKALIFLLIFAVTGCATMRAMREMDAIQKEGAMNMVAWNQARATLHSMCSASSKTNLKSYPCEPRLVKMSGNPSTDDWQFVKLPP
jgi:hypothetical protein